MLVAAFFWIQFIPSLVGPAVYSDLKSDYQWVQISPPGSGREEAQWVGGTWPRLYLPPVVRGDTLFLFGEHFTFTTTDGKSWHRRRHTGGWGERYGASHVAFDNRFWIMGGMKTWDKFQNDIWVSSDGFDWTRGTERAPWSERRGHAVFSHQGTLWLVGGAESSGKHDVLPSRSIGDVWKSEDGLEWQSVTIEGPWATDFSPAYFSSSVSAYSFLDRLWVFGGSENHFWHSGDGRMWERSRTRTRIPPRRAGKTVVFDDNLWLFGGEGRNDVWSSEDGDSWLQGGQAPWSQRAPGPSVVFLDRLWIFGGKTGRPDDRGDDLWTLQRRMKTQ